MLVVKDLHFCICCGSDLDNILKSLKKCVKRTRRKEVLLRELRGLECGGKVSPATFEQREEWYRQHGEDYADLVHSTVVEALHEAKEVGRIKALAKTIEEQPKEDSTPTQDSPKILRKPRVFNRK